MMTSEYVRFCMYFSEWALQCVLREEARIGRPCTIVTIFSMANLPILKWANPMSPWDQLWLARTTMWQQFYPEQVTKVLCINSPSMIGLIVKFARYFIPAQQVNMLKFMKRHADLLDHLPPTCVPKVGVNTSCSRRRG
jgi:hypothetical protein